jgi:hypothetical protein
MPTIPTNKPQWNVDRAGYSSLEEPLYDTSQVGELAAELRCSVEAIEKPLAAEADAIGPFLSEWREAAAIEAQQEAALSCLATGAESVLSKIRKLDRRSRRRLLSEYGADGDSEGDSVAAVEQLNRDVAALDRLHQNLAVATRRLSFHKAASPVGRPANDFERFAAAKLLNVCKAIYGDGCLLSRSPAKTASRRFLIAALMMIPGIKQSTARSAANEALDNAEKLPAPVG